MIKVIEHFKYYPYHIMLLLLMVIVDVWIEPDSAKIYLADGVFLLICHILTFIVRWLFYHDGWQLKAFKSKSVVYYHRMGIIGLILADIFVSAVTILFVMSPILHSEIIDILGVLKVTILLLLIMLYIINTVVYNIYQMKQNWSIYA